MSIKMNICTGFHPGATVDEVKKITSTVNKPYCVEQRTKPTGQERLYNLYPDDAVCGPFLSYVIY